MPRVAAESVTTGRCLSAATTPDHDPNPDCARASRASALGRAQGDRQALAAEVVDDIEDPKAPAIAERVAHEWTSGC